MNNTEFALTFDDITLVPRHSMIKSRKEPCTESKLGKILLKIPIIAAPMNTVTEWEMSQAMSEIGADSVLHRYMTIEEQCAQVRKIKVDIKPWTAIGATGDFIERAQELYKNGITRFCIDIANGHSEICVNAVRSLRNYFGNNIDVMAGNVCTGDGAKRLEDAGANVIRCGVGGGSVCTTRLVTGFGVPQLSAIGWCAEAVNKATIVADGGIRCSSDLVKSIVMGADAVMIGGLLAGSDQTPGETIRDSETGHLYKYYHGMASLEGRKEWFSKEVTSYVPEGASTKVPHKGDAIKIVTNLNNSLKVGMSFANAKNLQELRVNAQWVRITDNGRKEANPNKKLF